MSVAGEINIVDLRSLEGGCLLSAHVRGKNEDPVARLTGGERRPTSVQTSTVRRAFVWAAARLGIHGIRPYDLRHSYGTALYRVAGDTRLVKEVLGHSDTRMTERYTLGHVREAMRLATARFEKELGTPGAPPAAQNRAARGAGATTDA